jgi:preprotein translocase subunit Sec61beta
MKGMKKSSEGGGPMSSAGIMANFKISGGGPKVKPEVVIATSVAIILIILVAGWI